MNFSESGWDHCEAGIVIGCPHSNMTTTAATATGGSGGLVNNRLSLVNARFKFSFRLAFFVFSLLVVLPLESISLFLSVLFSFSLFLFMSLSFAPLSLWTSIYSTFSCSFPIWTFLNFFLIFCLWCLKRFFLCLHLPPSLPPQAAILGLATWSKSLGIPDVHYEPVWFVIPCGGQRIKCIKQDQAQQMLTQHLKKKKTHTLLTNFLYCTVAGQLHLLTLSTKTSFSASSSQWHFYTSLPSKN